MSSMTEWRKEYPLFGESFQGFTHPSGLTVQFVPKPGFCKKFAIFSVDFGSINTRFIVPGEREETRVPDGMAHFLEHKLFEQPEGNVMDRLVALGASPNAATSFSRTYYYFTCTDHFAECFRLLLHFVLHPYLTPENVEKEKGIIAQEINMYLDNPDYVNSMNLLRLLYHHNPIRREIAGSVEDIMGTTVAILEKCHQTFYRPCNMNVTVVGDLDFCEIRDLVCEAIPEDAPKGEIKRIFTPEPNCLAGTLHVERRDLSLPLFQFGFKDDPSRFQGVERAKRDAAGNVLKEMLFGTTSSFFETLYERGLINQEFFGDYEIERDYAMACLGGESPDPFAVQDFLRSYLVEQKKQGLSQSDFDMLRNAGQGRLLRRFHSPESIGRIFSSVQLQGVSGFDYFTAYGTITLDDVYRVFEEVFCQDVALAVMLPKEDGTESAQ